MHDMTLELGRKLDQKQVGALFQHAQYRPGRPVAQPSWVAFFGEIAGQQKQLPRSSDGRVVVYVLDAKGNLYLANNPTTDVIKLRTYDSDAGVLDTAFAALQLAGADMSPRLAVTRR